LRTPTFAPKWSSKLNGVYMRFQRSITGLTTLEAVMDLWFVGLIVLLSLLTWGAIVLFERLQVRQ
jgi:hypothetical protein